MPIRNLTPSSLIPTGPQAVYYNPRFTAYFGPQATAVYLIGGGNNLNLLMPALAKAQFSPSYGGPPPGVGDGWAANNNTPIVWLGAATIQVKISLRINVGRQIPFEVDALLIIRKNGVDITGVNSVSSVNRAPVGNTGSSEITLEAYTSLATNDQLECFLTRTGTGAAVSTVVNFFGSYVDICALSTEQLPLVNVPP
jgi:hypothetical protein